MKEKVSKTERTCLSCGETAQKSELFRWINANGTIMLDWQGKLPGRGVYTHATSECIEHLYKRRSFPTRFFTGKKAFITPFSDIFTHIYTLSLGSFRHFCSLGLKSHVLTVGQEGVAEKYGSGEGRAAIIFTTNDISAKTVKKIPDTIKKIATALPLDKEELGASLTGRPVGIFAVEQGSLSDRLSFYATIMTRFFSGDVHADK